MTHIITQKQVKRIKAIFGASYALKADSLLSELRKALVNKNKAFEALPHLPILTGDDLAFFGFFLEALLAYHEGNSPESVQQKLTQISNAIAPPSHVSSYYALSILLSIGTMYLSYVLIAIYFPVIAGAAIPYLLHHEVLTIILSGILFIYTAISAITAFENQHENQVKASLNQLLQFDYSKLDFPSSGESQSPSSLSETTMDDRKEDGNGQHLGAVLLKNESSPDDAMASSEQEKPENASGVELLQSGHLYLVPPSGESKSPLLLAQNINDNRQQMGEAKPDLPLIPVQGSDNIGSNLKVKNSPNPRDLKELEEISSNLSSSRPLVPDRQPASVAERAAERAEQAQVSVLAEKEEQKHPSLEVAAPSSLVSTAFGFVNQAFSLILPKDEKQNPIDLIGIQLKQLIPCLARSVIGLPFPESYFHIHQASISNTRMGGYFSIGLNYVASRYANELSDEQDSKQEVRLEYFKLLEKGVIKQVVKLPMAVINAFCDQFIEPWHIPLRKEATKGNISKITEVLHSLIDLYKCGSSRQDDVIYKMSKSTLSLFSNISNELLVDGLEYIGHTATFSRTSIRAVDNFLSQKNLRDWVNYFNGFTFSGPKTKLQMFMTNSFHYFSRVYQTIAIWNMLSALREAPKIITSGMELMNFIRNPEQAPNEYFQKQFENISKLFPKSQPWPADNLTFRIGLYNTLYSQFVNNILFDFFWLKFCYELQPKIDEFSYVVGEGIGAVMIGVLINDAFALESGKHRGLLSQLISDDIGFYQCMIDVFEYYGIKMLIERLMGYFTGLIVQGACKSIMKARQNSFKNHLENYIEKMLKEQLFNPGEFEEAIEKGINVNSKTQITWLSWFLLFVKGAYALRPPQTLAPQSMKQKFEHALVSAAAYDPKITGLTLIIGAGVVLCPKITLGLNALSNTMSKVAYKTSENPNTAIVVASGAVLVCSAYGCSPKIRKGVNQYVFQPVAQAASYLLRSPTIICAIGVGASIALEDPWIAASFALPAASNFIQTGFNECVKAAKCGLGFFSKNPEAPMAPVSHQAFSANP